MFYFRHLEAYLAMAAFRILSRSFGYGQVGPFTSLAFVVGLCFFSIYSVGRGVVSFFQVVLGENIRVGVVFFAGYVRGYAYRTTLIYAKLPSWGYGHALVGERQQVQGRWLF